MDLVTRAAGAFGDRALSQVLASTSLNFDVSVFEYMTPLTVGGRIEVVRNLLDVAETGHWQGSLISAVPSALSNTLLRAGADIQAGTVVLAGEALSLLASWLTSRTWSRRGHTPCVRVRAAGSGRISLAGLVCRKAGRRTRLTFRMLVHHGRKGEKKGFRERDFAAFLDAAHQQLGGNIVLVWDNYNHHVDAAMRELIAKRPWLTVFRFPTYTPDLNPAEGGWAHLKKSLGNLAPCSIDDLAGLVRTRSNGCSTGPTCSTGSSPRPD